MSTDVMPEKGLSLNVWHKLALVAAITLPSMFYLTFMLVRDKDRDLGLARREQQGARYVSQVSGALQELQRRRAINSFFARGDQSVRPQLDKQTGLVNERFRALETIEQENSGAGAALNTTERFRAIRTKWDDLARRSPTLAPAESYDAHSALCADLRNLIVYAGDTSHLILDPDLDTYYLMDAVVHQIPAETELLGQMQVIAAGAALAREKTAGDAQQLTLLADRARESLARIGHGMQVAVSSNAALGAEINAPAAGSASAAAAFIQLIEGRILRAADIQTDTKEIAAVSTTAMDELFRLSGIAGTNLESQLQKRADRLARNRLLIILAAAGGALLSFLAAFFVARGIRRNLGGLVASAGGAGAGGAHTSVATVREQRDHNLRPADAHRTAMTGIDPEIRETIGRMGEIAGQMEESAGAAHNTMQSMVEEAETRAGEIDRTAKALKVVLGSGVDAGEGSGGDAGEVNAARAFSTRPRERIRGMGECAQEIGEIAEIALEIAGQISILALNTSIQSTQVGHAAGPGAGRQGFAVAGEEIERLAGRASQAASRISNLAGMIHADSCEATRDTETTAVAAPAGKAPRNAGEVAPRLARISAEAWDSAMELQQAAASMDELVALARRLRAEVTTVSAPVSTEATPEAPGSMTTEVSGDGFTEDQQTMSAGA
ncbi:MAG: methyl-accepting chemotaxis protein [Blastocatellia bacterium]